MTDVWNRLGALERKPIIRLFEDHPQALESSLEILERCRFSLADLAFQSHHCGADLVQFRLA